MHFTTVRKTAKTIWLVFRYFNEIDIHMIITIEQLLVMVLLSTEVVHPNLRNEPHIFYSIIKYLGYYNLFIILIEFVLYEDGKRTKKRMSLTKKYFPERVELIRGTG